MSAPRPRIEPTRLEAFNDGVLAIVITIMVLELKVPHGSGWQALAGLWLVILSYILSFLYVGIHWNDHHLMRAVESISGASMWANLHLLFWLSLLPFTTGWMGQNYFARPTTLYGANLLLCAVAYFVFQILLIRHQGRHSSAAAVSRDMKGKIFPLVYAVGIATSWLMSPMIGLVCYVAIAVLWLIPDRRLERALSGKPLHGS